MNPVAITIINPWREYWQSPGSNQPPTVLNSAMIPNELLGLAHPNQDGKMISGSNVPKFYDGVENMCETEKIVVFSTFSFSNMFSTSFFYPSGLVKHMIV